MSDDLGQAIAEFWQRQERGEVVDIKKFTDEYSYCASELLAYFENIKFVDEISDLSSNTTRGNARTSAESLPVCCHGKTGAPTRLGDIQIVSEIGKGGMGAVYVGRQLSLNRSVAIKMLKKDSPPYVLKRFSIERSVLANLHYNGILPIHFGGETEEFVYFVMPYIHGFSLRDILSYVGSLQIPRQKSLSTLRTLVREMLSNDPTKLLVQDKLQLDINATDQTSPDPDSTFTDSIARVIRECAAAVQHVNLLGWVHRDIKPANIMIDSNGDCQLIDFGLAKRVWESDHDFYGEIPSDEFPTPRMGPTIHGQLPGSPPYMAPEQFRSSSDIGPQTDVWQLGVTLYEWLFLQRAYDGEPDECYRRITSSKPLTFPNKKVPYDLKKICAKAVTKNRTQRYPSANAMAEDISRWQRGEPALASNSLPLRRIWMWSKRNVGWASAIAALFLALLCGVLVVKSSERRVRRTTHMKQFSLMLGDVKEAGWFDSAWNEIRQAADLRRDDDLRDLAVPSFVGVDARRAKAFDIECNSLRYNQSGKQLLMADLSGHVHIWSSDIDEIEKFQSQGAGPVAFDLGDNPVQMIAKPERNRFELLNLRLRKRVQFKLPPAPDAGAKSDQEPTMALSQDAAYAAATTAGGTTVAIWDARTGNLTSHLEASGTSIAFTSDATLIAIGQSDGIVKVFSVSDGSLVAELNAGRREISAVVFGRRPSGPTSAKDKTSTANWTISAGDIGGTITSFDLATKVRISFCRGGRYRITSIQHSPDGVTMASCGRYFARLWDIATGRELVKLKYQNTSRSLDFAPDGRRLSIGGIAASGGPGGVAVYELEFGRGIRSFRGLSGQTEKLTLSKDERLIAAVSHEWKVGIWDRSTGRLLHVLNVPIGLFLDNADMAFSHDGTRFVFSAMDRATLWDVESGKLLRTWELPHGLQDTVAFRTNGELLLLRNETKDAKQGPYSHVKPIDYPRVARLRNLLGPNPVARPIKTIEDFNVGALRISTDRRGNFFTIEGFSGRKPTYRREVITIDAEGNELWRKPSTFIVDGGNHFVDPTGTLVLILGGTHERNRQEVFDRKTGDFMMELTGASSLGPGAGKIAKVSNATISLHRGAADEPLVRLPNCSLQKPRFTGDGISLCWGNAEGTVFIADLREVQRRLASVGLGWE